MKKTDFGIIRMVNGVNDGTVKAEICCLRLLYKEQAPDTKP